MLTRPNWYSPFREMRRMMDMMQDIMDRSLMPSDDMDAFDVNPLALDITTDDNNIVVKTALPGLSEDDVHIEASGNVLTIKAESKQEYEDNKEHYYRRELRYGKFARSVQLPEEVNFDKAEAALENGILTITLPKSAPGAIQKIAVKAKNLIESGKKKS